MSAPITGAEPAEGEDRGHEAGTVPEAPGDRVITAVTGLNMLGTAQAEVCDEDGLCAVPAPSTQRL